MYAGSFIWEVLKPEMSETSSLLKSIDLSSISANPDDEIKTEQKRSLLNRKNAAITPIEGQPDDNDERELKDKIDTTNRQVYPLNLLVLYSFINNLFCYQGKGGRILLSSVPFLESANNYISQTHDGS